MIDLHIHILPGLDDGAADLDEALAMARVLVADGVTAAVGTPHMGDALYNVPRDVVIDAAAKLKDALHHAGIPLELFPGGDVHLETETLRRLKDNELMTIADGRRYMLVELSNDLIPPGIESLFFEMQLLGVVPIVTHPERIREVQHNPDLLRPLIESGALIQVTASALNVAKVRQRGSCACAITLLERGMVHIVASDAHTAAGWRPPGLTAARQVVANIRGAKEATTIFEVRPKAILHGEDVPVPEPGETHNRKWWWPWL